jgi:hypothetical protein
VRKAILTVSIINVNALGYPSCPPVDEERARKGSLFVFGKIRRSEGRPGRKSGTAQPAIFRSGAALIRATTPSGLMS